MLLYPIYFVHHDLGRWDNVRALPCPPAPSELPGRFADGWDCWVVQPYLHLKRRGWDVHLSFGLVPGALNVMHADTFMHRGPDRRAFTFVIRPDRPPVVGADVLAVQNPVLAREAGGVRSYFVPLFPEPGLLPRDPARGARLERIAFLGRARHLAPAFQSHALSARLEGLGVEFVVRESAWWDYRDLDAVLAVRDAPAEVLATKPATKLYNAWLAGCIPLLGPEPAYEALRQTELDYVPVRSPADVVAAVASLRRDPPRLEAIRQNGFHRAQEFSTEHIVARWEELLSGPVAEAFERWRRAGPARRLARRARLSWASRRRWSVWDAWDLRNGQITPAQAKGRWSWAYLRRRLLDSQAHRGDATTASGTSPPAPARAPAAAPPAAATGGGR